MGHYQCTYSHIGVHDHGDDGILQKRETIFQLRI